jgi:hypothetical protein
MSNEPKLNRAGIRALAADLVAHHEKYDQGYYGMYNASCGTVACMAGFCLQKKIGVTKFNKLVSNGTLFSRDAIEAGIEQLFKNYANDQGGSPVIFAFSSSWPTDLAIAYSLAGTPKAKVIVALKALSRLKPNGYIDSDPKAIHTPLSVLTKLLKEGK